jgi:hypothetical protein
MQLEDVQAALLDVETKLRASEEWKRVSSQEGMEKELARDTQYREERATIRLENERLRKEIIQWEQEYKAVMETGLLYARPLTFGVVVLLLHINRILRSDIAWYHKERGLYRHI